MEHDAAMMEILKLCMNIDAKAAAVYKQFSNAALDQDLKNFWEEMAGEESKHVCWWKHLKALAQDQALPPIFDDPVRMHNELMAGIQKIDHMIERTDPASISDTFLAGSRFEFFMQHRVFATLFEFISNTSDGVAAEHEYENHVKRFIKALEKYGENKPELEILGETLDRMWRDNMELATLSNIDPLTGVFNRRGLFQTITPLAHLAWRNNYHVGLIMIDIDNFKSVNDTLGHFAGDDVLSLVASSLVTRLRRSDVIGRYGGEEFLIFLSHVEQGSVDRVAETLRAIVETETAANGPLPVTISVGACEGVLHENISRAVDAFTRIADQNLYSAKANGKNCVVATHEQIGNP
jgi:diguanylate cyclase (GGDEF)-like protein